MKKKLVILGMIASCFSSPMSIYADVSAGVATENIVEISPRISVSKYVRIQVDYAAMLFIPQYYKYSYYDHDYSTTLSGTLFLADILPLQTCFRAIFTGDVSGSI